MTYETKEEKRKVSETMDSLLLPLLRFLSNDIRETVELALRKLRDMEVQDADSD